jgi:transcriptional repressor NrdR
MNCPECQNSKSQVVDSRGVGGHIRRRRECLQCAARFTTHERIELPRLWVLKKSGRKEPFSTEKVLEGISLACRKRPVSADQMDEAVAKVRTVLEGEPSPVPSSAVGEAVMSVLLEVDAVAYVRFASVYREFESVEEFIDVIRPLTERR